MNNYNFYDLNSLLNFVKVVIFLFCVNFNKINIYIPILLLFILSFTKKYSDLIK
jgi:hypothetical protein